MSQRHLADVSGVDQSAISRIERGADACWTTLRRLFGALGYAVELTVRPRVGEDDVEDFLLNGVEERKDRMEEGRAARW